MKTSELIDFFKSQPFTETQAFNLLIADINEALTVSELGTEPAQKLIRYFMYKIQAVMLPVIQCQNEKLASACRVAEMETSLVAEGVQTETSSTQIILAGNHRLNEFLATFPYNSDYDPDCPPVEETHDRAIRLLRHYRQRLEDTAGLPLQACEQK